MILARPAALFLFATVLPAQSWDPFGSGCPGTVGVPVLTAAPGGLPRLGCPFTLQLGNLPEGAPTFVVFGFSKTDWGGLPLPYDLGQFGMTGCTLYVSTDAVLFLPSAGGTAEMTVDIPNWPVRLEGVQFYNQAAVVDSGPNPIGVVSNAGAAVIGPGAPAFDATGTWELTVTSGANNCGDPVGVESVFDVTIAQNGSELTVTTPAGDLTGTLSGWCVRLDGDLPDGTGTSTNVMTLTISPDGMSLSGVNVWSWTDTIEFCTGTDEVSATLK